MPSSPPASAGPPSERVRLRRKRERGCYDRAVIDEILDEALIAHLGIVDGDGQPIVTPLLHARRGDLVYLHGSVVSRTLKALAGGLVLARSAMHHSTNYRSVMLFGQARSVDDPAEKLTALQALIEHIVPGRWPTVRAPTENELRATAVLSMEITEVSAKIRNGGPIDDEEDYSLEAWAGVIPLSQMAGDAQPDPRMPANIPVPAHVAQYNAHSTTLPAG
jgi:nitroimidazol reductase NimA-like FMN-containing flavoprotein (pyridoxamine 5'-phosphate oxidase superfamily)